MVSPSLVPIGAAPTCSAGALVGYVADGAHHPANAAVCMEELHRLASAVGIDPAVAGAIAAHETDRYRSAVWRDYRNPCGLFRANVADGYARFANGVDAARALVVHLATYRYGANLGSALRYGDLDPRAPLLHDLGYAGRARSLADLRGKWATDPAWPEGVAAHVAAIRARSGGIVTTPPPALSLPIRPDYIPWGMPNRPGTELNAGGLWIVIHETGNEAVNADAEFHARFAKSGGGVYRVSYHLTVDDTRAIQLLPLNEVAYHAADGLDSRTDDIGGFAGVAIETCVDAGASWQRTTDNLAELCARIILGDPVLNFGGRRGAFSAERITQHFWVSDDGPNKHDCPYYLRNGRRGIGWTDVVTQVRGIVAARQG